MCGFAGIAGRVIERAAKVAAMTRAISHRGPDGEGLWEDEGCGLGHRRLAILDLSPAGAQPMSTPDGAIVIAFNGEIYDFADHKRDLEMRGHVFRSRSDTEVLLALYREHGPDFASRVEGMFAFAIWDRPRRRLLLGRDRFGQKPLYIARLGGALAFGSEVRALLALPEVSRAPDLEAIDDLLCLHFVPAPRTSFAAIRQVPKASILLRAPDGSTEARPMSLPGRPERAARAFEESVELADRALRAAVKRALVADVPLGLFLSGGVDSSLIASYVAEEHPGPVEAFTATFAGADTDELPYAQQVGERLGVRVHPVHIVPSSFRDPAALVAAFEEPFADVAALPTAMLAAAARRTITVALTGDGGDEVFGGYEHHVVGYWLSRLAPLVEAPLVGGVLRRAAAAAALRVPIGGRRTRARTLRRGLEMVAGGDAREASLALRLTLATSARRSLYTPAFLEAVRFRDPAEALAPAPGAAGLLDLLDPDRDMFLSDMFLRKTDVATMSVGLESRAPLLDRAVVELGRSLPADHLVRGARGKCVLRALLARKLGPELARRRKMGFAPPVAEWLRGDLAGLLEDTVLDAQARIRDLIDPREVARLVAEHKSRRADHRRLLWALLLLELWLRRHGSGGSGPLT